MKFYFATLATLLIASVAVRGTGLGYKQLNNYLIQQVNNDEVAPNMEAANKWIQGKRSIKLTFLSKSPIRDFKKFVSLQQVIEDTECDRSVYEIMRQNVEAVGLHRLIEYNSVIRRVDKVMLSILTEHARRCALVYPVTYRKKLEQLDKSKYKHVENLGQSVMKVDKFYTTSRYHAIFYLPSSLFDRYIKNTVTVRGFIRESIFYDVLLSNAENDPNFKYARTIPSEQTGRIDIHKDKLKELAKKYLVEPCQYYVNQMGPDLFIPARFEAPVYVNLDHAFADFYRGWSYYEMCKALVSDERAVYDYVIKSAASARD